MSKKRKRQPRIKISPLQDPRFKNFYKELSEEKSSRAAAIVGHTFLHGLLQENLRKRLVENKELVKQIDDYTFIRCVNLCYLVGTISLTVRSELIKVNTIRNIFAHELVDSFDNDKVTEECSDLGLCRAFVPRCDYPFGTSREKYVSTVIFLMFVMIIEEMKIKRLEENRAPLAGETYSWKIEY